VRGAGFSAVMDGDGHRAGRRLRVAVIAADDPINEPLLRALEQHCDVAFLLTVEPGPLSARLRRIFATSGRFPVVAVAQAVVLRLIDRQVTRQVARLIPAGYSVADRAERVPRSYLTDGRAVARLRQSEPDLLLVSLAPILSEEVFTLPRLGTVNVHWGLARRYRGNHTLLYPLYRGEYDAVGLTLHYVDRGIDTGPIIAEERLAVGPSDSLAAVSARAAELAARVVTDFIRDIEQGRTPEQPSAGRGVLIRYRDRKVRHYVHHAVRRRVAALRRVRMRGASQPLDVDRRSEVV
jgi:methionyl-tRNA formyltransferase